MSRKLVCLTSISTVMTDKKLKIKQKNLNYRQKKTKTPKTVPILLYVQMETSIVCVKFHYFRS